MPEVIGPDALTFAKLRAAHLEPPRQVADDLLAAAAQPAIRLAGVTAYEARMMAANVLSGAGDRARALEILDSSPDTAGAGLIERASRSIGTGDLAGAQDFVRQIRSWPVGDSYGLSLITELVLHAAYAGYFDQALVWTGAAWAAAISNRSGQNWVVARGPLVMRALEEAVRDLQQRPAAADGIPARPKGPPVRSADIAGPDSALVAHSSPWPAVVDGRLLWWPDAEYERLVAQVPDVRSVLGSTWRQHTAKVESTLRAFRRLQSANRVPLALVHAEFGPYVRFLEQAGSDPRLPEPLTAFTGSAAEHQKPVQWPPGRLDRCWCGSRLRYSRCCGATAGG